LVVIGGVGLSELLEKMAENMEIPIPIRNRVPTKPSEPKNKTKPNPTRLPIDSVYSIFMWIVFE